MRKIVKTAERAAVKIGAACRLKGSLPFVQQRVIGVAGADDQVSRSVVGANPVNVMNAFAVAQRAANNSLGYGDVLKDLNAVDGDPSIAIGPNPAVSNVSSSEQRPHRGGFRDRARPSEPDALRDAVTVWQ